MFTKRVHQPWKIRGMALQHGFVGPGHLARLFTLRLVVGSLSRGCGMMMGTW